MEVGERRQWAIALPQRIRRREQTAATGEQVGSGHRRRGHDDDGLARPGIGLVLDHVTPEGKIRREFDRAVVAVPE